MSAQSVLDFFQACAEDEDLLQQYSARSLPELLLHARNAGFDISQADLTGVIGAMEVNVIMERAGEEIDAYSSLWPKMWGKQRFQYVVDDLYRTFSEDELEQFVA